MKLDPDVYEPSDDTELLIRVLREREPELHGARALDVGTGSGAVAAALVALGARVVALDVSPHAVAVARENAPGADVVRGDLMGALRGPFDLVAFNAPYLPSEPEERLAGWIDRAFHGGEDGIEVSQRFVAELTRVLALDGRAYLVVSSRAKLDQLAETARAAGLVHEKLASARWFFEEVAIWRLKRTP